MLSLPLRSAPTVQHHFAGASIAHTGIIVLEYVRPAGVLVSILCCSPQRRPRLPATAIIRGPLEPVHLLFQRRPKAPLQSITSSSPPPVYEGKTAILHDTCVTVRLGKLMLVRERVGQI